jgi:hypothetical protein
MLSIGPWLGFRSFKPLKAQTELACVGAPVSTPEPEKGTPAVPGGPVTSPARAAPVLRPATTAAQIVAANILRIVCLPLLMDAPMASAAKEEPNLADEASSTASGGKSASPFRSSLLEAPRPFPRRRPRQGRQAGTSRRKANLRSRTLAQTVCSAARAMMFSTAGEEATTEAAGRELTPASTAKHSCIAIRPMSGNSDVGASRRPHREGRKKSVRPDSFLR